MRVGAAFELLDVHAGVDLPARGQDGLGQAGEVAQRMELGLAREAQGGTRVEGAERSARDLLDFEAGAARRLELAVELVRRLSARDEQVAVHAREVAGDAALGDDRLDAVDGGGVALRGQPRPRLAVELLEAVEVVVERAGQVRGGAARSRRRRWGRRRGRRPPALRARAGRPW